MDRRFQENGCLSFLIPFLWILRSTADAQDIGVVRCYVCKSNVFVSAPVKNYANCPDLLNSNTTTVKYCRACYKYTGDAMVNYNQSMKGIVSRGCFDENAYSTDPNTKGIFQTSGLLDPNPGAFAITNNMAVSGKVGGIRGGFLSYGPGELNVCNDQDVCNGSQTSKSTLAFSGVILLSILLSYPNRFLV